jgi:hypothetical protein
LLATRAMSVRVTPVLPFVDSSKKNIENSKKRKEGKKRKKKEKRKKKKEKRKKKVTTFCAIIFALGCWYHCSWFSRSNPYSLAYFAKKFLLFATESQNAEKKVNTYN